MRLIKVSWICIWKELKEKLKLVSQSVLLVPSYHVWLNCTDQFKSKSLSRALRWMDFYWFDWSLLPSQLEFWKHSQPEDFWIYVYLKTSSISKYIPRILAWSTSQLCTKNLLNISHLSSALDHHNLTDPLSFS
jgi:hypothetical protein